MLGAKQEHYGKKYKNFPNLFSNFDTIYLWRLFGGFMEKKFADQMIEQFQTKFFGFALSKCQNMQEAEELEARINQLVEKCIEIEKKYFPKHMQEMWEIYRRFSNINTIKVIDELLERGTLKPLTQTQRKGVMIILYLDFLPVRDEV